MTTIRPSLRRRELDEEDDLHPNTFGAEETPGERLDRAREAALEAGGRDKIAKQHQQGKMTARERVRYLLDAGSFAEVDAFALPQAGARELPAQQVPGDGVVGGFGRIDGREVAIVAQDFTVLGGSLGAAQARKVCKVMDQAREAGVPFVQLNDSGGARIQEGISSLGGYGDIFHRNVALSGVVPQISVILGPCAGGAVYSPAVTDFIIMSRASSHMFVTGPDVVRQVLGEDTTFETLGGADVHASESGVAHLVGETEREALDYVRELLSFLPSNNHEEPPRRRARKASPHEDAALDAFIPSDPKKPYDVRDLVRRLADDERFLETHSAFAPNVVVGFARLDGRVIGIVANQPAHLAGVLDSRASEKAARFVRFCDAFNVPLVSLVDVPGFMPGKDEEHGGVIRRGAKLLYAYSEASVPKLTVITRKAYGGAYIVMCSKHLGADVNLAWPGAEIAVLGAEGAVKILYKRELLGAPDSSSLKRELESDYRERFGNPFQAAELGFIDEVIHPRETRGRLIRHLARLAAKRPAVPLRRHGNIPL